MNKAVCGCGGATVNKCVTQNKKADSTACSSPPFPHKYPNASKSPHHHVQDISQHHVMPGLDNLSSTDSRNNCQL